MKNKFVLLIALSIIFIGFFTTNFFSNIWGLLAEKEYFIPKESSVFSFKATKFNEGSGDWWIYGNDENYYYGLNQESNKPRYFLYAKGKENKNFDMFNYETWK